jgi:hypothetical protein
LVVERRIIEAHAHAAYLAARAGVSPKQSWPDRYVNTETGKPYKPHHKDEERFVYSDSPRYLLAKGGEGGGKSVAGIIKTLNRLRQGMNGIMVSPDFEHFKKSLWPEFRRWCPANCLIEKDRYRLHNSWEARQPFELHFQSESGQISTLYCGGIEDPAGWEGPNVSFAHFDEARRHKTPEAVKVLDGRVRIPGLNGEKPQLYLTSTPRKHWLYDYFGDIQEDDPYLSFKEDALCITLLTEDNEKAGNLSEGYTRQRGQSLTESEKRVRLLAEWEDEEDATRFLDSILLWDRCEEPLEPMDRHTPLILALDGAYAAKGDVFGGVATSRHPLIDNAVALRAVMAWEAKGSPRDFEQIQDDIKNFCIDWNVIEIVYDPMQLVQMMQHLKRPSKTKAGRDFKGVITTEFKQGVDRLASDKQLLDLVISRLIGWSKDITNHELLRKHLDNADKKLNKDGNLRIVKRAESLKIDLAVCLSMASARALSRAVSNFALPKSKSQSQLG